MIPDAPLSVVLARVSPAATKERQEPSTMWAARKGEASFADR